MFICTKFVRQPRKVTYQAVADSPDSLMPAEAIDGVDGLKDEPKLVDQTWVDGKYLGIYGGASGAIYVVKEVN